MWAALLVLVLALAMGMTIGQCNGEGPTFYTCNTEAFILVPKNGIGTV